MPAENQDRRRVAMKLGNGIRGRIWAGWLAAGLLLVLSACGPEMEAGPSELPAWGIDPGPSQSAAQQVQAAGEIVYDEGVIPLTQEQEGLIHGYMTAAYEALAQLEEPDFSVLFADPVQVQTNESAITLQIGPRTLIPEVDYSLTGYSYTLTCREMVWREDGRLEVRAEEASVQNFASQCLLAGGIPMDTEGPDIWKWYGPDPSETVLAEGRSPSWSGVNQFREYAMKNNGFGLSALVDAPYYTGQPGDLIQMGTADSLRHTVVVRDLATDAAGQTVDYLVHSNTNDMENYPASLYGYPVFSLIRIIGWNRG